MATEPKVELIDGEELYQRLSPYEVKLNHLAGEIESSKKIVIDGMSYYNIDLNTVLRGLKYIQSELRDEITKAGYDIDELRDELDDQVDECCAKRETDWCECRIDTWN